MDYFQNGPVCKHVGAVLLTLATGGPGGPAPEGFRRHALREGVAPQDDGAPQPEAASSSVGRAARPGLRAGPNIPEAAEQSLSLIHI
eukprot:3676495-Alexandrium_andersonii.AAC.1